MTKKVIRNCIFETNSSSVHTLVLRKKPSNRFLDRNDRDKYLYGDDKIDIFLGEFGWGYDIVSGFREKAGYLATMIAEKYKYDEYSEDRSMEDIIEKTVEDPEWQDIASVICNNFDLRSVVLNCNGTSPRDFYIDHQSWYPSIYDFLEDNGGYSLSDYLFNEDISVEISNDNSYPEDITHCRDQNGYK